MNVVPPGQPHLRFPPRPTSSGLPGSDAAHRSLAPAWRPAVRRASPRLCVVHEPANNPPEPARSTSAASRCPPRSARRTITPMLRPAYVRRAGPEAWVDRRRRLARALATGTATGVGNGTATGVGTGTRIGVGTGVGTGITGNPLRFFGEGPANRLQPPQSSGRQFQVVRPAAGAVRRWPNASPPRCTGRRRRHPVPRQQAAPPAATPGTRMRPCEHPPGSCGRTARAATGSA